MAPIRDILPNCKTLFPDNPHDVVSFAKKSSGLYNGNNECFCKLAMNSVLDFTSGGILAKIFAADL